MKHVISFRGVVIGSWAGHSGAGPFGTGLPVGEHKTPMERFPGFLGAYSGYISKKVSALFLEACLVECLNLILWFHRDLFFWAFLYRGPFFTILFSDRESYGGRQQPVMVIIGTYSFMKFVMWASFLSSSLLCHSVWYHKKMSWNSLADGCMVSQFAQDHISIL